VFHERKEVVMASLHHILRKLVCFLAPAYWSMSALVTVSREDDLSWLRYWVVIALASVPELVLDKLNILPHYNVLKYSFIGWCLIPGPLSGSEILFKQIYPIFEKGHNACSNLAGAAVSVFHENVIIADIAYGAVVVTDFVSTLEHPLYSLFLGLGCIYICSILINQLFSQSSHENLSFKMTVDRVDDAVNLDHNSLTQKMKMKSQKIVMDAEKGEAKLAIEKCKKFLSSVESSNFKCKIFINSWEDIDGTKAFDKIVSNIGAQLKLPKEDIEGIKLAAMGGSSKRDYLSFDCAMKDKGEVRLHTGGYSVLKKENDKMDFQIVHHYIDMNELTLKRLPVEASEAIETGWFRRQSADAIEFQQPEEGKDWNTYFQYEAHKNLLKELPEDDDEK